MKKIIPIIGLCSILYFSGINSTPALAKDGYIHVKEGKGYVYTVSENEGNKQLHEVAKTAEKEDAWIYTAGKWYDIGFNERKNGVSSTLDDIVKLLKKNHKGEKEAKFVHIHPKKIVQEMAVNIELEMASPPSTSDIATHILYKRMLRDKLKMKLVSEVYDGSRVWTYDTTNSLEAKVYDSTPDFFTIFCKLGIIERTVQKEMDSTLNNKSLSIKEKIERHISTVKKFGVILSYTTLEK